jgi:hypothetical protein
MPVLKKKSSRAVRTQSRSAGQSHASAKSDVSLERAIRKWEAKVKPLIEAARSSERLSEGDFEVRINARG